MLFDLQGPRKTFVKVIYLGLAILMGGGLVLFGIGSDVQGGFADVFSTSSTTKQARNNVEKYAEQVQKDPKNKTALQSLIGARYTLAADEENFNQETGEFSEEGTKQLNLLKANWETYLKLTDNKPEVGPANFAVSAYLGLNDAKGAADAQAILTRIQPNPSNYLALMLYASYAGQTLIASGAEQRALEVATKEERAEVREQIKEIKSQVEDRQAEFQRQIQEQFSQQAQQSLSGGTPTNPFAGAGTAKDSGSTK